MPRVAVVGKGLFGAAAGRHLARAGLETVIVGPDEPPAISGHEGPFGAHYDEARILVARGNAAEVALTRLTIEGMLELEQDLGRRLIVKSGGLEVAGGTTREPSELVDGVLSIPHDAERRHEPPPQGHFNPRRYIAAALEDAVAHGAEVVRAPVDRLQATAGGIVLFSRDRRLEVDRTVVAAGAWSNRLLPRPVALRLKTESVLFAELEAGSAAAMTRPAVVHGLTGSVEDVYVLPPLQYPDGKSYLKLGANTLLDRAVAPDEIDHWYRDGGHSAQADLEAAFRALLPQLAVSGFHTERCVITYTPHGRPYLAGLDTPGLFVVVGGNGHGASWADGAGRLAAALVGGDFSAGVAEYPDLVAGAFSVLYEDEDPPWPRPLLLADRA